MVVLIIEGSDLVGKSTAIERISKYYKNGFLIKNLYKPSTSHDEKIYHQYYKILNMIEGLSFVILDRFFPSQAVYSVKRGEDEMNSEEIKFLDEECVEKKFIYVYLDTSLAELERRYNNRGDEHIAFEDLTWITERYDIFWKKTKMRKIKLDTMKEGWLEELSIFITENKYG